MTTGSVWARPIVSIEMLKTAGESYWSQYFQNQGANGGTEAIRKVLVTEFASKFLSCGIAEQISIVTGDLYR